jgi:hypothetical protein
VAAAGDNVDRDARRTTRGGDDDDDDEDDDGVVIVGRGDDRVHDTRPPRSSSDGGNGERGRGGTGERSGNGGEEGWKEFGIPLLGKVL